MSNKKVFESAISDHVVTIVRDDGVYRHLRCSRKDTMNQSFEILTWPGYLAFVGDMGDYVFRRLPDMFEFFRDKPINLEYWAEKVVSIDKYSGLKKYSEQKARELVLKEMKEAGEVSADDRDDILSFDYEDEHELRKQLSDYPEIFVDMHEVDFSEYTFHYEWCCRAIVWAIVKYDLLESGVSV